MRDQELNELFAKMAQSQITANSIIENLVKKVDDLMDHKNSIVHTKELSEEGLREFKEPGMTRIHMETRTDPRMPWVCMLVPNPEYGQPDEPKVQREFCSFDDKNYAINYTKTPVKSKRGPLEVVDYSITGMFPIDSIIEMQSGIGRLYFICRENGTAEPITSRDAFIMAADVERDNRKEPVELSDNRKMAEEEQATDSISELPF